MTRRRTVHRCTDCGAASPRWTGRCPTCGEWNTLAEEVEDARPARRRRRRGRVPARPDRRGAGRAGRDGCRGRRPPAHGHRRARPGPRRRAGARVGDPPRRRARHRQVHAAPPGARRRWRGRGARCLLVCAEESPQQVKRRAARLGALARRGVADRRRPASRASPRPSRRSGPTCWSSTPSRRSGTPRSSPARDR